VEVVPRPERSFLLFDDQRALTGEHEEAFLDALRVVQRVPSSQQLSRRRAGSGMVRDRSFTPARGICGANFLMPFVPPVEEVAEVAAATREVECDPVGMAMHAGTGVGDITSAGSAADAVSDLVRLL
jgi:hypothetical protein